MKYALIILIYISAGCNFDKNTIEYSKETLDTLAISPAGITAEPLLFETAFIKGTKQILNDSTVQLYGINIGNIKISSGRITTCDPMHIDEYGIPFTQLFPTGEFPVHLAIAKQGPEERIAFARIQFSNEPVARWAFALQEGQAPIPVGGKKMYGYGVDGSLAIFADMDACKVLNKDNLLSLNDSVYREMDKHTHYDWRYNIHHFGNHNLAMFSTGFGDGRYAVYIGFDTAGNPCRLLTDLAIFDWKRKE